MEPPREEKSLEGVGSLSTVALEGKLGFSLSSGAVLGLGFPACFAAWPDSIAFPAAVFATRLRLRIPNVHRSIGRWNYHHAWSLHRVAAFNM